MNNRSQSAVNALTPGVESHGLTDRIPGLGSLLFSTVQRVYNAYTEHELMRLAPTRLPRD
jgi:hypothetical protein